jgi:hypothetical protein
MNKYETRLFYVTIVNFLELGAQPTGTVHGIFLRAKMFRFKHAFKLIKIIKKGEISHATTSRSNKFLNKFKLHEISILFKFRVMVVFLLSFFFPLIICKFHVY